MRALFCFYGPIATAGLIVATLSSSGCGRAEPDGYAEHIRFPERTAWIVEKIPPEAPTEPDKIGELDEVIQKINAKGGKAYDPRTIDESLRANLNSYLLDTFGTPAHPTIKGDDVVLQIATELHLTPDRLTKGSALYRKHCQQCHGIPGDGRGPTGAWLATHPRDFRESLFKFASTNGGNSRKPTRDDLFLTISRGIPTTSMPSFAMQSDENNYLMVDYSIFLSIRGRVEFEILKTLASEGEAGLDADIPTDAANVLKKQLQLWQKAQTDIIAVNMPQYAEGSPDLSRSIERGHALFLDPKGAACMSCHLDYGRQSKAQYDQWGFQIKAPDLTNNSKKRKWSDQPEHLFRIIRGGIAPSNMPAAFALNDQQTADVVNFLKALPYPARLPDDVKKRVYGE